MLWCFMHNSIMIHLRTTMAMTQTDLISLDLAKAFDNIVHQISCNSTVYKEDYINGLANYIIDPSRLPCMVNIQFLSLWSSHKGLF